MISGKQKSQASAENLYYQKSKSLLIKYLFFIILLLLFACSSEVVKNNEEKNKTSHDENDEKLASILNKDEIKIVVTDSGLGGLSILADLSEKLRKERIFKKNDLIFFNALFNAETGYNSLPNREQKIKIFNSALHSMERLYAPDIILIGCNTLSTIYNDTPFSKQTGILVYGIVETGVDMIMQKLQKDKDAIIIIFATETTIQEGNYLRELKKRGVAEQRVISQACPQLQDYIEKDFNGEGTEMLISAYVDEALEKIKKPYPAIYISLNCTHFGYSIDFWKSAFQDNDIELKSILNPNFKIADILFSMCTSHRFEESMINIEVVSKAEISEEKRKSVGGLLYEISPQTAEALKHYKWDETLFSW